MPIPNYRWKEALSSTSDFTCAWSIENKAGDILPSRTIVLETKNAPKFMKGLFKASVRDDLLVGVRFYTFGVHTQSLAFEQLKQKYGEPISFTRREVQSTNGTKIEAISAQWRSKTIVVVFEGVIDRIDLGLVTIETEDFFKMRSLEVRRKNSIEIKM